MAGWALGVDCFFFHITHSVALFLSLCIVFRGTKYQTGALLFVRFRCESNYLLQSDAKTFIALWLHIHI